MKHRKWLSILLALLLVLSLLPAGALAAPDTQALTLGENSLATTANADYTTYTFTPEENGMYTFYSVGDYDPAAALYDPEDVEHYIAYGNDYMYDSNFFFGAYLTADKAYLFKIENLDYKEEVITVFVEKTRYTFQVAEDIGSAFVSLKQGNNDVTPTNGLAYLTTGLEYVQIGRAHV